MDEISLYELLNGQSLNTQVNQALRPVGPYDTSVASNAITPTILATQNTQNGLLDSLQSPGFWQGTGSMLSGLGSIGNIWLGSQSLGLLEDQLAMQQDAWNEQKQELDYMRQTRDKLNTSYMA